MKTRFVANGFERWSKARNAKTRETIHAKAADKNQNLGRFGKIQMWFKTELQCLRRQTSEEKSSPKILW